MQMTNFARGFFGSSNGNDAVVERALHAVRTHLGMQVAYVSEFVGDLSVFRHVDAPGCEALVKVGDSMALDDVYCRHILAGRLPELIPDTAAEPIAVALPITRDAPIGSHVSVPIRLPGGEPFGMFCCLGFAADASLGSRDLGVLRAFADIAAFEINRDYAQSKGARESATRIGSVIDAAALTIAYQPIWDIASGRAVGVESLARFAPEPYRTPDLWFAEAVDAGLGIELEVVAIRSALAGLAALPPEVYLAVNASPATILDGALDAALASAPRNRLVLEITEHATIVDYPALLARLAPLRRDGLRVAIDDAGVGYSSLRHILSLGPDLIKLDMSLTRDVDADPVRRALVAALVAFAAKTGRRIVAEGSKPRPNSRRCAGSGWRWRRATCSPGR